ncbi:MAG: family metallopeptidase [Bacteroidetes bacterium]|jgi:murein DD-endopeptidase MepM/ murein hydrolase activator NlpD|nr:family metallopeptidase [Bacteroidota bacterium]
MVETKKKRWARFLAFLRNKYRLVILNDATFGEKFSLKLSPWGLIIGVASITIVMTTIVISLVAFTPLREYIPGYGTVAERKQILDLTQKADSIEEKLQARDSYISNILNVLSEKHEGRTEKPKRDTTGKYANVNVNPSSADVEFRNDYENNKNASIASISNPKLKGLSELVFYTPVRGVVLSAFNLPEDHFGIDVVTKADEIVKSTLDGTVVFTGFSAEDGYVIHVQHSNNLTSIYKHNAELLKRTGERLKSGEAIAVVGNTGEKSKGPHLHFELWYNGIPINPQDCVAF